MSDMFDFRLKYIRWDKKYGMQILNGTAKTPAQRISEIRAVTLPQVQAAAKAVTLDTVFMLAGTGEEHHD